MNGKEKKGKENTKKMALFFPKTFSKCFLSFFTSTYLTSFIIVFSIVVVIIVISWSSSILFIYLLFFYSYLAH